MEKKIPKVYANEITKEINNNSKIYVSKKNEQPIQANEPAKIENKIDNKIENKTIIGKINSIMNSRQYIYKIPVKIETDETTYETKIIGKNSKSIITIDNKLIPIEKIIDINLIENKKNE